MTNPGITHCQPALCCYQADQMGATFGTPSLDPPPCTLQLVAAMRAAVHSVLQGLQLQQPVSSDMAMGLLSDIHHGAPPCSTQSSTCVFTRCVYFRSAPHCLHVCCCRVRDGSGGGRLAAVPAAGQRRGRQPAGVRHVGGGAAHGGHRRLQHRAAGGAPAYIPLQEMLAATIYSVARYCSNSHAADRGSVSRLRW